MARKNDPNSDDLEFSSQSGSARSGVGDYPGREFDNGEDFDSARLMDVEPEQESPFLRAQKRVPVRRGPIPKKTAKWLRTVAIGLAVTCGAGAVLWSIRHYALKAPQFAMASSSDEIQITGNRNATREDVLAVFGEDISRNVFRIPLEERKRKLEEIPWIESAMVMRFLPNRVAVVVKERTPVGIVQTESRFALIDANGVLMDISAGAKYSFPVLTGFSESDPLSTRAARVRIYMALVRDLDSEGKGYSQDLSEVDVTNPEDIRITVSQGSAVLHMGKKKFPQEDKFLEQYSKYLEVLPQCRARFGTAAVDVDTRFDGQTPCRPADRASASIDVTPGGTEPIGKNADESVKVQESAVTAVVHKATNRPTRSILATKKPRWRAKRH